jgi:hypothetical protein
LSDIQWSYSNSLYRETIGLLLEFFPGGRKDRFIPQVSLNTHFHEVMFSRYDTHLFVLR